MNKLEIDLVIPWVDGNDPEWQKNRSNYRAGVGTDTRIIRYREWDNLQYWFRGVEQFLPWIRRIHFITVGHLPEWLNVSHPKLNVVRHQDYIPEKYLPTFSANPIEMNVHRIKGLADHFIYSNDDMFFIRKMDPEDFFRKGLPCDVPIESIQHFKKGGIDNIVANDLAILNAHFSKKETIKENLWKWYYWGFGKKLFKNLYLFPFTQFLGFENPHIPFPFLKQTLIDIWNAEPELLDDISSHKFRSITDVNQWLIRYWQFASGNFYPGRKNLGQFYSIGKDDSLIKSCIETQKFKMICLSDDDENLDFEYEKKFIQDCFEKLLPEKSSFEY